MALVSCVRIEKSYTASSFELPRDGYRIVIMPPDVIAGTVTTNGTFELREDWTARARANVLEALLAEQTRRDANAAIVRVDEVMVPEHEADPTDLIALHRAIGQTISMHKRAVPKLPTKVTTFDWTFGESARRFGAASGGDFALFFYARDTFASKGRNALRAAVLAAQIATACPFCYFSVTGGWQSAFASLVDLESGDVVWFGILESERGDIREEKGATKLVNRLFESMYLTQEDRTAACAEMYPGGAGWRSGKRCERLH